MPRLLVLIASVLLAATRAEYADSDVIDTDAAGLTQLVEDPKGGTLVTFYAPWCGHCVKMVPEFKKTATSLLRIGVRAAAVNSDANPGLAQSLGIRGFPSVRFVYNGQWSEYKGPRTAMEMTQWAGQQAAVAQVKRHVGSAIKSSKMLMSKVLGRAGQASPSPEPVGQAVAAPAA